MSLTRAERFKDARTVHNKHGSQTINEVAEQTGIAKSMISALENDEIDRDVGYQNIAKLAKHYGVTSDFLLGLAEKNLTLNKKELSIFELPRFACAVNSLRNNLDKHEWKVYRRIIETQTSKLLYSLYDYAFAHSALKEYKRIFHEISKDYDEIAESGLYPYKEIFDRTKTELIKRIDAGFYFEAVARQLKKQLSLINEDYIGYIEITEISKIRLVKLIDEITSDIATDKDIQEYSAKRKK